MLGIMKYASALVTAASGSIRGCTFSRNRTGAYIRGRVVPVNPGSIYQQTVRGYLATLVARWTSVLTPAERSGWDTWALNTPQPDSINGTHVITGQNAYIKANALRMQAGQAILDDAPTLYASAVLTPPVLTIADTSDQELTVTFNIADEWAVDVDGSLLVYMGRPQNPSVNFYKGPYRFLANLDGSASPLTSPHVFPANLTFALGQRVPVAFRAIAPDGRISSLMRSSIIAVA